MPFLPFAFLMALSAIFWAIPITCIIQHFIEWIFFSTGMCTENAEYFHSSTSTVNHCGLLHVFGNSVSNFMEWWVLASVDDYWGHVLLTAIGLFIWGWIYQFSRGLRIRVKDWNQFFINLLGG